MSPWAAADYLCGSIHRIPRAADIMRFQLSRLFGSLVATACVTGMLIVDEWRDSPRFPLGLAGGRAQADEPLTASQAAVAPKPTANPVPAPRTMVLPGETFVVAGRTAFIFHPMSKPTMAKPTTAKPGAKQGETPAATAATPAKPGTDSADGKSSLAAPKRPQPWVLYAPTLPPLPDSHEKWMHERFTEAGIAVAGIDVGEAYGSPEGQRLFTELYRELVERRGFAAKPVVLGRSRGGLLVAAWAGANPDKVAGLAGIYPVFDFRSYPGLANAAGAYGLKPDQLEARRVELNPIEQADRLARAKVPVFLIHGDVDRVVPLRENSGEFTARYKAAGAENLVRLVVPEGQGHNFWPGFFRCQELIDFVIAHL
ncbi:MAG: alpha/beta hydrolase family protein [Planctomycetota bacterium]